MSASKVNPNTYKGEERSGGYIAKNAKPASTSSPDWKGKIYLEGVGWYWLSAWVRDGHTGKMLSLRAQEMTDEQAAKFCAPKHSSAPAPHRKPSQTRSQNGTDATEPEIPF